jgi:hypothetical protein
MTISLTDPFPHERRLTDTELETIGKAIEEYERLGSTEIKCPRCGKALLIQIMDSGCILQCESSDCVKLSMRGI